MTGQGFAYLFVPGNRPERFAKACDAAPGMVILDLEDAVSPDQKDAARAAVSAWLTDEAQVIVRINAEGTPWFDDDVRLVANLGVKAVMLPKAESAETVRILASLGKPILPLIETAKGVANAREIARQPRVANLVFGSIDLKVDLGVSGDDEELNYFRSELVLASRLAEIQAPIDGVTTSIEDGEAIRRDTLRGKRFGFGSKLCIHPKQVGVVNTTFAPSEAETDWAKRVLDAVSSSGGSAVSVDGKMVDKPVISLANRILGSS